MRPATHDKTAGNSLKGKLRRRIGKSPVRNMDVCLQKPDESVNFVAELLIKHTVIMKKFTSLSAIIMMMAMAFTFVSCDDDEYIADTLWGVWQGDMHVYHEWSGTYYEAHESVIQFQRRALGLLREQHNVERKQWTHTHIFLRGRHEFLHLRLQPV